MSENYINANYTSEDTERVYNDMKRRYCSLMDGQFPSLKTERIRRIINSKRTATSIVKVEDLLSILEARDELRSDDVSILRELAQDVRNDSAVNVAQDYTSRLSNSRGYSCESVISCKCHIPHNSNAHVSDDDLSNGMAYLARHLGRQWKDVIRRLDGMHEKDIDTILYRRGCHHVDFLQPQRVVSIILECLQEWKTNVLKTNDNDRIASLIIKALDHCKRFELIDHLKQTLFKQGFDTRQTSLQST